MPGKHSFASAAWDKKKATKAKPKKGKGKKK